MGRNVRQTLKFDHRYCVFYLLSNTKYGIFRFVRWLPQEIWKLVLVLKILLARHAVADSRTGNWAGHDKGTPVPGVYTIFLASTQFYTIIIPVPGVSIILYNFMINHDTNITIYLIYFTIIKSRTFIRNIPIIFIALNTIF